MDFMFNRCDAVEDRHIASQGLLQRVERLLIPTHRTRFGYDEVECRHDDVEVRQIRSLLLFAR